MSTTVHTRQDNVRRTVSKYVHSERKLGQSEACDKVLEHLDSY